MEANYCCGYVLTILYTQHVEGDPRNANARGGHILSQSHAMLWRLLVLPAAAGALGPSGWPPRLGVPGTHAFGESAHSRVSRRSCRTKVATGSCSASCLVTSTKNKIRKVCDTSGFVPKQGTAKTSGLALFAGASLQIEFQGQDTVVRNGSAIAGRPGGTASSWQPSGQFFTRICFALVLFHWRNRMAALPVFGLVLTACCLRVAVLVISALKLSRTRTGVPGLHNQRGRYILRLRHRCRHYRRGGVVQP